MSTSSPESKPSLLERTFTKHKTGLSKRQATTIAIISTVVIIAIVATCLIVSFFAKSPTEENFESKTYTAVTDAVTVNGTPPSSTILAPATKEWWGNLLKFSSDTTLDGLDFDTIKDNASYVSYTVSSGTQYKSVDAIGVPTMFVVYKDSEAARKAGITAGSEYSHFVRGNLLLFIPHGAFTDLDYSLTQYDKAKETIDSNDLNLDNQAMWQINVSEFNKIISENKKEDVDVETYAKTLEKMGITKDTEWVGYSTDGLNWEGTVSGLDNSKVETPKQIEAFLANQMGYLKTDGTTVYGEAPAEKEQSGILVPRQSRILGCCMVISNNDESAGVLLNLATNESTSGEALPKKEGIFQIEAYSNTWFALMLGQDTAYPVSKFDKVTFTVKDTRGNSTISLEPMVQ
jgi:hypothetical protein